MYEDLDNALMKVTEVLDLDLDWEKEKTKVRNILLEIKGRDGKTVFDLIQRNAQQYPLLAGFCYHLGIGTVKNHQAAFDQWRKDATPYGDYLLGRCYFY